MPDLIDLIIASLSYISLRFRAILSEFDSSRATHRFLLFHRVLIKGITSLSLLHTYIYTVRLTGAISKKKKQRQAVRNPEAVREQSFRSARSSGSIVREVSRQDIKRKYTRVGVRVCARSVCSNFARGVAHRGGNNGRGKGEEGEENGAARRCVIVVIA